MCINKCFISIIIPTFRPKEYLWKCLGSLENQTLEKSKFEVLIVLNGSEESYRINIENYIQDKKCLNYFLYNIYESGVSNARNFGILHAKGKYICFIDDDDYVSPTFLENLLVKVDKHTLVVSDFRTFCDDTDNVGYDYVSQAFKETKKNDVFCRRSFLSSSCGKLIDKSIIGEKRFPVTLKNSEDAVFMFAISNRIKQIVLADSDTIYYRRIRLGSASRRSLSLNTRMSNMYKSIWMYTKVYFSSPFSYNILLYLSRMIATVIYFFRFK